MARLVSIILILICFGDLYAQDQWLVTAKLDTVRGKIFLDYRGPYQADEAVVKVGKEKTAYKAYEVRYVWLGADDNYEGIKIDQRYQFGKVDVRGKYFTQYLYADPSTGNTANYSLKLLVEPNGKQSKLSNLIPKKRFAQYFEACESVAQQILSGELKRKNLDQIFDAYDDCVDNKLPEQQPPVIAEQVSDSGFEQFIEALKSKGLYTGDLSSMIDDVNQKVSSRQSVPEYLQRAVLEQLGNDEELKSQFRSLLEE